jgi:GT2 family glycosyltransferase
MIRREAFNDIGLLDERFFMYSEEKDWCYRARLKGWPVALYPGTEIVHLHGDSSTNPKLFGMMMKSKKMFLAKNYPSIRARLIMAIMFLNLAVRFAGFYVAASVAAMIAKLMSHPRLQGCLQAHSNDRIEGCLAGRLQSRLDGCLGNTASSSFSNRLMVIKAGLSGVD